MRNTISKSVLGRVSAILVLGLVSVGCTTWVKPGASEFELQATTSRCEAAAMRMAPPEMYRAMISAAREDAPSTFCNTDSKGKQTCNTTPGRHQAAVYQDRDSNESARRAIVRDCMFSHGWRPE